MEKPMQKEQGDGLYLRKLELTNFKGIDDLEIEFPSPLMADSPDIIVFGSKNGVGKTSILEAIGLIMLVSVAGDEFFLDWSSHRSETILDLRDWFIGGSDDKASVKATFEKGQKRFFVTLTIELEQIKIVGDKGVIRQWILSENRDVRRAIMSQGESLIYSLLGINNEPLLLSPFIYFHSYRKVQEGSVEFGTLLEDELYRRRPIRSKEHFTSMFKWEILRSMMGGVGLFENITENEQSQEMMDFLNKLLKQFANGKVGKLLPTPRNTLEIRITPENGTKSFSFDALSSGQKEMISTLFLIWRYTHERPGIILIDEPELHLNAEWHRTFIRHLLKINPRNQYIIATHSEDIFSSVEESRRLLLKA